MCEIVLLNIILSYLILYGYLLLLSSIIIIDSIFSITHVFYYLYLHTRSSITFFFMIAKSRYRYYLSTVNPVWNEDDVHGTCAVHKGCSGCTNWCTTCPIIPLWCTQFPSVIQGCTISFCYSGGCWAWPVFSMKSLKCESIM